MKAKKQRELQTKPIQLRLMQRDTKHKRLQPQLREGNATKFADPTK